VAGRPLRPATDHRLGGPLPRQLANRTRAPPEASFPFGPQATSGISCSFPRLFRTSRQVPTRYSPVRHSLVAQGVRLACVRHAASVRSEPGSNSQVNCPAWRPDNQLKLALSLITAPQTKPRFSPRHHQTHPQPKPGTGQRVYPGHAKARQRLRNAAARASLPHIMYLSKNKPRGRPRPVPCGEGREFYASINGKSSTAGPH
jgi:hypothetical protein